MESDIELRSRIDEASSAVRRLPSVADDVMRRIEEKPIPSVRLFRRHARLLALGAAVGACLVLVVVALRLPDGARSSGTASSGGAEVATATGDLDDERHPESPVPPELINPYFDDFVDIAPGIPIEPIGPAVPDGVSATLPAMKPGDRPAGESKVPTVLFSFVRFEWFRPTLVSAFDDSTWGFVDKEGTIVVEPKYSNARDFSDGLAAVKQGGNRRHGGKWGFVDREGNEVIPPRYERVRDFSEGLATVELEGKRGFVDRSGKLVIALQFEPIDTVGADFREGRAVVYVGEKCGYIDSTGKLVVPPTFENAGIFSEGLAGFCIDGKQGYIDLDGNVVVQPEYDVVYPFREGLGAVQVDGKWSFIDKRGQPVTGPEVEGKQVYLGPKGRTLFEPYVYRPGEGLIRFSAPDTYFAWGFRGPDGQIAIKPDFEWAEDFVEGRARIAVNVNWKGVRDSVENGDIGFTDGDGKPCTLPAAMVTHALRH